MRLTEIGYEQVQRFVDELGVEVSPKTVHNALILLRVMLTGKRGASAIKRGLLRSDPTRGIELPSKAHRRIQPLSVEAVWKLIHAAEELGKPHWSLVFLDAHTGLRRNEILALHFTDVDWKGESAKYVCDQMGHSSIQITFDTYGHLFPQSRRKAAVKLQAAMNRGKYKANSSGLVAVRNISARKRLIREDDDD